MPALPPHTPPAPRGRKWFVAIQVVTAVLLVVGIFLRGISADRPLPPEERGDVTPSIEEPMQLLLGGSFMRILEIDPLVAEDLRQSWREVRNEVYLIDGCPTVSEWIEGAHGQACERLLADLRHGTSEEALGALALLFELARRLDWETGTFGGSQDAEQLAGHLAEWLRVRGDASAEDPILHEPAMAAMVLYGRTMRIAYLAPVFGTKESALERARSFLRDLTGAPHDRRTEFGTALQARFGRAMELLSQEDDPLEGFEEEAGVLFPDLDGECDG